MRKFLLASWLLLLVFKAQAQLPIGFQSYAIRLTVTKDESMIMTTKAGEVGLASSFTGKWERSDPKDGMFGRTLEGSNFFNKDTGFVSGFISNGKSGKYNIIYHTVNGGTKWEPVNFGQDGWVDMAANLDNGEAWLSVSGSGIAYSSNYGFDWKKFFFPGKKERFKAIFFNRQHQGVIGSLWNTIYFTGDNCISWIKLPTPLDQKKYTKTNVQSRPGFDKVALYKNLVIAKQEELVFYTKRDSIDWKLLPEFSNFFTDADNTALFFATTKKEFVKVDDNLSPIYHYNELQNYYDACCRNGDFYVASQKGITRISSSTESQTALFSMSTEVLVDAEPKYIGYSSKGFIGKKGNQIFSKNGDYSKWEHLCTLPVKTDSTIISFVNESLLVQNWSDSLFYFSLEGCLISAKSKQKLIADFCEEGINKISFTKGSRGCFHNYQNEVMYSYSNGAFRFPIEKGSNESYTNLPDSEEEIPEEIVNELLNHIPDIFTKPVSTSIADLDFSESDYKQCKKDILEFRESVFSVNKRKTEKLTAFNFSKNNIDFDRLIGLVDSIKTLSPEQLFPMLFNLEEIWSTTTNWTSFRLVNNKNEELVFTSSYFEPNAFYFPWTITLNGYSTISINFDINRFVNAAYPALLSEGNKVDVLHKMVKALY